MAQQPVSTGTGAINRQIRYPPPETEEERYQRQQETARLSGVLSASGNMTAANTAAAAYLRSHQPSLIPPINTSGMLYGPQDSARAASATHGAGPSELDRRARDAMAIIQLRLLREKLRRERELLNNSSECDDDCSSESSGRGDSQTELRVKQALAQREDLVRQIEELKLGLAGRQQDNSARRPITPLVVPSAREPQNIVVKVDVPKDEHKTSRSDIQTLSAAIREAASATVAPQILPPPTPRVVIEHAPPPPQPQPVASGPSMGDKYQDLMEMMMMQNYQMQQMVMQQALLGAVTGTASAPMPGLANCNQVPMYQQRPAIVQIAGKKRNGHAHHHHHHANPAAFQPHMGNGGPSGSSAGDRRLQQQIEQQQQMIQQMQQQMQMLQTSGSGGSSGKKQSLAQTLGMNAGRRGSSSASSPKYNRRAAAAAMAAMDSGLPNMSPAYGQAAIEVDPLSLPKDRRREVKEAKLAELDWNAEGAWWKKDRVAIKMRHFFYVAWFIGGMKAAAAAKGKTYNTEKVAFDDIIAFEIIIREIITAIHRIYLDPDSEMFQLLQTLVSPNAIDLRLALRNSPEALQEITYLIENITFQMTYIQTFRPLRYHLRLLLTEDSPDLSRALAPYLPIPNPPPIDQQGNPKPPPTNEQIDEATRRVEDIFMNITYHIAGEIPDSGVLGCHRRSHLFALIKDGQLFPAEEFWDIEKKLLRFDSNGRTVNIGTREAMLLITMFFLARGLVWTILLNPVDYGLTPVEPDPVSKENLKLMASLFIYLYRRLLVPRDARVIPPAPPEIAYLLVRDEVLQPLLERLENTILYCDGLVREWANAYVRRLKQALPPKIASN